MDTNSVNSTILDFLPKTTKRDICKIFSVYFSGAVVAALLLAGFVLHLEYQRKIEKIAEDGSRNLQLALAATRLDLELLAADLRTIANSPALGRYLRSPAPETLKALTGRWQTLIRNRKAYELISYVDLDAAKGVAVAARGEAVAGTDHERERSPEERLLLEKTLLLAWGDILVAPPDAATVTGQSSADPPPPALRVATPVVDPRGQNGGIILINLGVSGLHDRLTEAFAGQANTRWMIVDGDGSWLLKPRPEEAAAVLPTADAGTIGAVRPELWRAVRGSESGRLLTADGLFAFTTIIPEKIIGRAEAVAGEDASEQQRPTTSQVWHFIALVPASELSSLHFLSQYRHLLWVVPLVLLALAAQALHLAIIKASREKRERSLNLLATAIDQSPTAVVITDIDGRIRSVNANFQGMSGYRRSELLGKNPRIFRSAHTSGETYRELWRTIRSGNVWVGDLENRRKDGTPYYVSTKISPIFEKSGEITGFLALQEDVTETRRLQRELERLATTDGLTGVYNRNHFLALLQQEFRRAERYDQPLSILVMDIDHFKAINDTYGHLAGDRVLAMFAEVASSILRDEDFLGRLGGEEFGVVLIQTSSDGATLLAERLRGVVETMVAECDGQTIRVTVSTGGTAMTRDDREIETLLRRADQALYAAKREGRNLVRFKLAEDDQAVLL
jgi:diguanylate cyclase (GGDEF)-like protein/PAS domain S-box-containing protein